MKFFGGIYFAVGQQNLRNEFKSIVGFPELSRPFGPAVLVPGSVLRSLCPAGPTGLAVSEPLHLGLHLSTAALGCAAFNNILLHAREVGSQVKPKTPQPFSP